MAVPKKRKSIAKSRSRRSANRKLVMPKFQRCPNCFAPKQSHHACRECGFYREEQVVEIWEY
jgi:large subunit ribosomal protein L32